MNVYKYFLRGVSSVLEFGKSGGLLKWITDHFAVRNPADDDYARIKIARGTEITDAVRLDQLNEVQLGASNSGKGSVKELIFCLTKDGSVLPNLTNGMLKRGAIIETIRIEIGEAFDGTLQADFGMFANDADNTKLFGAEDFDPSQPGQIQEKRLKYILGEDLDVSCNMGITGGTAGDAMVTFVYTEPVLYSIPTGNTIVFTPSRKLIHLDFLGADGETMVININGTLVTCGMVDGNFVFDIPDDTGLTYTFTTVGEEYTFVIDGKEYQIINETEEV